jgi:hypothetical protein
MSCEENGAKYHNVKTGNKEFKCLGTTKDFEIECGNKLRVD